MSEEQHTRLLTPRLPLPNGMASLHLGLRAAGAALIFAELALSITDLSGLDARRRLIEATAVTPAFTLDPIRLLGHALLHAGPWHLIANLVPLILFGDIASVRWGIGIMWAIAFTVGLAGLAGFYAFGADALLIGASGIAYGLAGAVAILWRRLSWTYRAILFTMAATVPWHAVSNTGVAWEVHAAAALAGMIFGVLAENRQYAA